MQRYDLHNDALGGGMRKSADGEYVMHEDAERLYRALLDLRTAVGKMPMATIQRYVPDDVAESINSVLSDFNPPKVTERNRNVREQEA